MEENKPHTTAHIAYISEDGSEASVVHIFPNSDAMGEHMQNLGNLGMKAFSLMEIIGFDVYGTPNQSVLDTMLRMINGAKVIIRPELVGGYIRIKSN
ncbi:MAG: hypothetical protein CVU46_00805 [Chloroflexi bacterium HGW-Chloroflexi-8]|jgi:glycosyltransferase A (GT-A) superfamily protein (DUF2064 family)|nr:MAG: hypothetical protein CVU46_00805 [Chloroflexi bacterium HGW-Chloroflexi-8]